jgi:hypothetical protein
MRWYDPATDTWWTRRILGDGPCDVNVGRSDSRKASPREFLDAHTPHHLSLTRMTADAFEARMGQSQQQAIVAGRSRAYLLRTTLGTSRPFRHGARGHELEGGTRARHPQVLGALLRASIAAEAREDRFEETVFADEVEDVTTVDDMSSREERPAAPVATEPEAPPPARTVPPPLPQTSPPPAVAPAAPPAAVSVPTVELAPQASLPPVASTLPPPAQATRASSGGVNSTVAIAAIAAAVVLGLALRDRSTSPSAPAPAAAPVQAAAAPQPAPTQIAATPAPSPTAATTPPAPQASTQAAASPPAPERAAPRPRVPAPVARAPRPTSGATQDSLDNLIDDRR